MCNLSVELFFGVILICMVYVEYISLRAFLALIYLHVMCRVYCICGQSRYVLQINKRRYVCMVYVDYIEFVCMLCVYYKFIRVELFSWYMKG